MRVISRKKIRLAIADHAEWEASLNAWYKVVRHADWRHFEAIKWSWRNVDRVGRCVVFDIANIRCRLVAWIKFDTRRLFIRHILSHPDYGKGKWKDDCHNR